MANIDSPRGFRLYQNEGKCIRSREYTKTAAAVILEGALVKRVAAGTVEAAAPGDTTAIGVAAHYSAADKTTVSVIDDPEATYVVQTADAYVEADNGLNVDIVVGTATGPDSKRSGSEIDMSTKATTATLPFKIIGLAPKINNEPNDAGVNADILVTLNQSERGAGTTGV